MTADQDVDVYARLIADLDAAGARYRLIEHAPEGRTELVSALRGHALAHAAKCLVLMIKLGKKQTRYVLAVVPGDARLELIADPALLDGGELYFNAGRPDHSVALASEDYVRLAQPASPASPLPDPPARCIVDG